MLKKAKPSRARRAAPSSRRSIDTTASQSWGDLHGRFQIVTKARANIWLTAGVLLFIVGFIAAFVLVVASPSNADLESRATHAAETVNSSQLPQLTKDLVNVSSGGSGIAKFFRPQNKTADANSAAIIAQQRAKLMSATVDKDADLALQSTLSAKDRSKIPATVQKYVEQPITNVTGVVGRIIGETFKAGPEDPSLDTYTLTTKTGQTQELKFGGVKLDAVQQGIVGPGAEVTISAGLQLPGGEIVTPFQNLKITKAAPAQALTGTLTASVIGFRFSDQAGETVDVNSVRGVLDQVANWYHQYSGGTLTIQYKYGTSTPTVAASSNVANCRYFDVGNPGRDALAEAGAPISAINIYIVPRNEKACGSVLAWGSLGKFNGSRDIYVLGTDSMSGDAAAPQYIITHEMGHTFGLNHTQGGECCDPMRATYATGQALQPFTAGYQSFMGWLDNGGEQTASTTKTTYTLNSIESASGLRNININTPCDGGTYNLERRDSEHAFLLHCTASDAVGDADGNVIATTEYITQIAAGSSYVIPGTAVRITAKSDSQVEVDGASSSADPGSGPGSGGGPVPGGVHSGNSDCAGTNKQGGCFALTCPATITASHGIIDVPIGATGDYLSGIVADMRSNPAPGISAVHAYGLAVGVTIPFPVSIREEVPAGTYDLAINGEGTTSPLDSSFHGHYPYSVCTTKLTILDSSTGGGGAGDLSLSCPGTQYIVLPSASSATSVATTTFGVNVSSSQPTDALVTFTGSVSPQLVGDGTYPVRLSQTSTHVPGGTSVTVSASRFGAVGGSTYGSQPGHYTVNIKARLGAEQSCDVPLEVLAAGSTQPAGDAPTVQLTANGRTGDVSVSPGSSVLLAWTSSSAAGCTMTTSPSTSVPGIGVVGTLTVHPTVNTLYQVACFASGAVASSGQVTGKAADSRVTVRVNGGSGSMTCTPPEQTVAVDTSHPSGGLATIDCNVSGADNITFSTQQTATHGEASSCLDIAQPAPGTITNRPAGNTRLMFGVHAHGGKCNMFYDMDIIAKTASGAEIDRQNVTIWEGIITTGADPAAGYLVFSTPEVHIKAGEHVDVTVSGGARLPYEIFSGVGIYYGVPNSNIATASVSGSKLTITGVGPGETAVTVSDQPNQLLLRSYSTIKVFVDQGTSTTPTPTTTPTPGTQPSITISSPQNGDEIAGDTFDMSATFSNIADGKIRMLADGVSVGTCVLTETPCVRPVPTTGWVVGSQHTLTAKLKDNDSVTTSITVKKKAGSTPSPTASPSITFDEGSIPGPTVSSSFTVSATATNLAAGAFIKIQADDGENTHNCPSGQATCSLQVEIANWIPGQQYHIWASVKDGTGQLATTANPLSVQKVAPGSTPPPGGTPPGSGAAASVSLTVSSVDAGHMIARAVLSGYSQPTAKFKLFAEDGNQVGACAEGSFTCEATFGIKQWTSGPHTITVNVKDGSGNTIASADADFTKP